ncbi:hypothetical protein ACS0TY_015422 [Phlomoides rotata]
MELDPKFNTVNDVSVATTHMKVISAKVEIQGFTFSKIEKKTMLEFSSNGILRSELVATFLPSSGWAGCCSSHQVF